MSGIDYEKYLVRNPYYPPFPEVKNRQGPMVYMSNQQIPGVNYAVAFSWIYGMPDPNPHIPEQVHNCDKIIMYWGSDPGKPQVLGGEIEFYLGGQSLVFNTTTAIFVPRGVKHGPIIWRNFDRPHLEMTMLLEEGNWEKGAPQAQGASGFKPSPKAEDFDYEQYLVRSPIAELGDPNTKGRTYPTMTYMSKFQIPGVNYYLESSWLIDMPDPNPHIGEHYHELYDEIVLHVGGDPQTPEDLGAEMEICVDGQPLVFDTNTALYLPKGAKHGPLTWKSFRKPHIETAIMLGAGSFAEGWGGELPKQK